MSAARYLWLYILTNFYPNVCHAHAHLIVILCSSLINRVHLIASVPGAHTGANMDKWGHMKLRKVYICERERERERRKSVTSFLGANMVYRRKAYRKFSCMHENG